MAMFHQAPQPSVRESTKKKYNCTVHRDGETFKDRGGLAQEVERLSNNQKIPDSILGSSSVEVSSVAQTELLQLSLSKTLNP